MAISCLKYDNQALGGCSSMVLIKFPRAALLEGCDYGYRAGIRSQGHRHLMLRTCKQDWIIQTRLDSGIPQRPSPYANFGLRISDCGFR